MCGREPRVDDVRVAARPRRRWIGGADCRAATSSPSCGEPVAVEGLAADRCGRHTRSTRRAPNTPVGLKTSTTTMISRAKVSCSDPPRNVAVAVEHRLGDAEAEAADDRALDAVEPAEQRGRRGEDQDREERAQVELVGRQHRHQQHAGERADGGRDAPAQAQHPTDLDARQRRPTRGWSRRRASAGRAGCG